MNSAFNQTFQAVINGICVATYANVNEETAVRAAARIGASAVHGEYFPDAWSEKIAAAKAESNPREVEEVADFSADLADPKNWKGGTIPPEHRNPHEALARAEKVLKLVIYFTARVNMTPLAWAVNEMPEEDFQTVSVHVTGHHSSPTTKAALIAALRKWDAERSKAFQIEQSIQSRKFRENWTSEATGQPTQNFSHMSLSQLHAIQAAIESGDFEPIDDFEYRKFERALVDAENARDAEQAARRRESLVMMFRSQTSEPESMIEEARRTR